jgi:polyribonucleotide 5'-hydroxyl-kinase
MAATVKYELDCDEELRIAVDCLQDETIEIKLIRGSAEIFGSELEKEFKYVFKNGAKFAIFTYQGCSINITGNFLFPPYKSEKNPMIMYLNIHAGLEQCRQDADESERECPEETWSKGIFTPHHAEAEVTNDHINNT